MIDLYTWGTPNGRKVSIMLEALRLPYRVHPVNILDNEQFEPTFLKHSPNNKIPAIVDQEGPDGEPISVFESGAILLYLAEKTCEFIPTDPRERMQCMQWLMWQMGDSVRFWARHITLISLPPNKSPMRSNAITMKHNAYGAC